MFGLRFPGRPAVLSQQIPSSELKTSNLAAGRGAQGEAVEIGRSTEIVCRLYSQFWIDDLSIAWKRRGRRRIIARSVFPTLPLLICCSLSCDRRFADNNWQRAGISPDMTVADDGMFSIQ